MKIDTEFKFALQVQNASSERELSHGTLVLFLLTRSFRLCGGMLLVLDC